MNPTTEQERELLADEPAFPVKDAGCWQAHGMTLRDYFAGQELTNMAGRVAVCDAPEVYARAADHCYRMADAMLRARAAAAIAKGEKA